MREREREIERVSEREREGDLHIHKNIKISSYEDMEARATTIITYHNYYQWKLRELVKDLLRIEDEFSPVGKCGSKFPGSMPSQRASEATIIKEGWVYK